MKKIKSKHKIQKMEISSNKVGVRYFEFYKTRRNNFIHLHRFSLHVTHCNAGALTHLY